MRIIDNDHERVGRWVFERCGGIYTQGDSVAIGLERSGQIIGGVVYDHYNVQSVVMNVAGEGNWLTRKFLWFAFYYPFEQMKVKKIIGLVDSSNLKAIQFDEHLGFQLEHRIIDGGQYGDQLIYTMTKPQCRWLSYGNLRRTANPPIPPTGSTLCEERRKHAQDA